MISEKDGQLFVSGPMNQQTAAALMQEGASLFADADRVVDLSAIEAVDSAALAVLLGWKRLAQGAGRSLAIVGAPQAFVSLASLYGITPLLFPESGNPTSAEQH